MMNYKKGKMRKGIGAFKRSLAKADKARLRRAFKVGDERRAYRRVHYNPWNWD